MNSTVELIVTVSALLGGFLLFIYFAYRAVNWAKRKRNGSDLAGGIIGLGSAINPAEAVAEEKQRVKRSDEGSGDPESRSGS